MIPTFKINDECYYMFFNKIKKSTIEQIVKNSNGIFYKVKNSKWMFRDIKNNYKINCTTLLHKTEEDIINFLLKNTIED